MKKDLQLMSGKIIVSSKLTKGAKEQLLNFVQHEADEHQLMALILDGKITSLDDQAKEVVSDRFKVSKKFNK